MSKPVETQYPTKAELEAVVAAVYEEHPELREYKRDEWCCLGCITEEIRVEHGKEAADAWERAHEAEWLLGG